MLYSSVYTAAELLIKNDNDTVLFIWGGNTIASLALRNLSQENSVPALFFDFGNYDDKIFVDPYGTNIDSFIYNKFELLFNSFESNSITNDLNLSLFTAKQRFYKKLNLLFFFDIVYNWATGLPFRGEINPFRKIHYLIIAFYSKEIIVPLIKDKFYFIAFSHSYEIKRLEIGIPDVVRKVTSVIDEAKNKGRMVFAKFHPSEIDKSFIKSINRLENVKVFKIVDNDSSELIEKAEKIYLFNTSLSIPAILKSKSVIFMCKSFFDKFNKDSLQYYLDLYLLKLQVDTYGNFQDTSVESILKRLEITRNYKIT